MKKLQEYIIPFSTLKEGLHEFVYEIDDRFFEYFENPDIKGGKLTVNISLQKSNTFLELEFQISGTIKTVCDRCLDVFNAEVQVKEVLFFRFGEEYTELQDNVIIIPREEKIVNVSQYIYEYAALNLPIKRVHPADKDGKSLCNPEMLKILMKFSVESKKEKDPIWESLKDMIN